MKVGRLRLYATNAERQDAYRVRKRLAALEQIQAGQPVPPLKAPFPWFGGKTRAAPLIWQALGPVGNYVEPFAGSLAVLLNRPHAPGLETVNDRDGFVCNVFRSLRAAPAAVARWCDRPVAEADLHAMHVWLVGQRETLTRRLMGDPHYYDAQVAGYWLYGICAWIGGGWCSGRGPWHSVDGQLVAAPGTEAGIKREIPHLGSGRGILRRRIQLSNTGQGVHRKRIHLHHGGQGIHQGRASASMRDWFDSLQARLRRVRICCGDWTRVLGPSVTWKNGITGILLDPPYSAEEGRDMDLYSVDDGTVAHAVRAWCLTHGDHPSLRIVLCGYGEGHDALLEAGWRKQRWVAPPGMSNLGQERRNDNRYRETLWLSPHCLTAAAGQLTMW
jgi:hypothetical protein